MKAKIGLEVHVQLTNLKTKLFCPCPSDYRGKPPNTNVCPVCLGLPGALPTLNREAVISAIKVALALKSEISRRLSWARKHYFYPDLSKGYQITQYDGRGLTPFARGGSVEINVNNVRKTVRIRRVIIEEDPARIVYPTGDPDTSPYILIDYNRSGIALLEIVTEPDMSTAEEVAAFLLKLRSILEHLEVCDFHLEGSIRADINVSVEGGERVEIKNVGGIKDAEMAVRYEIARQEDVIKKGGSIARETRHWDPLRKITKSARVKELEEDYRYMPEPNLPEYYIPEDLIEEVKASLPVLPEERAKNYILSHGLSEYLASVLVSYKQLADYYDKVVEMTGVRGDRVAGLIVTDALGWLPAEDPKELWRHLPPERLAELVRLLEANEITIKMAKEMIPELIKGISPNEIVKHRNWKVIRDESYLYKLVLEVLNETPGILEDVVKNPRAIQYVIGKVLEKTDKRGDPRLIADIAKKAIHEILSRREGR